MKIFSLHLDFFNFLEKIELCSEKWPAYSTCYYQPHREFLENTFSHYPLINISSLKERVEAVKAPDYAHLKSLVSVCSPEGIIREAYEKCKAILPPPLEPEVFLFVGFFSPDGFVIDFHGSPVICFGLERFRDFTLLKVLFAHEYTHFLLNLSQGDVPEAKRVKWLLISEGLGTYFSSLVFSEQGLSDHFLFRRDRLNWCQENETHLKKIYCSGKFSPQELMDFYARGNSELNLPPRAAKYLGYRAVEKYFARQKERNIGLLLSDKDRVLSLKL